MRSDGQRIYCSGFKRKAFNWGTAEREVRKVEKRDAEELKEAAGALVEYLRKKQTPMTTAIVTGAGVEILSTEIHVPFEEEW